MWRDGSMGKNRNNSKYFLRLVGLALIIIVALQLLPKNAGAIVIHREGNKTVWKSHFFLPDIVALTSVEMMSDQALGEIIKKLREKKAKLRALSSRLVKSGVKKAGRNLIGKEDSQYEVLKSRESEVKSEIGKLKKEFDRLIRGKAEPIVNEFCHNLGHPDGVLKFDIEWANTNSSKMTVGPVVFKEFECKGRYFPEQDRLAAQPRGNQHQKEPIVQILPNEDPMARELAEVEKFSKNLNDQLLINNTYKKSNDPFLKESLAVFEIYHKMLKEDPKSKSPYRPLLIAALEKQMEAIRKIQKKNDNEYYNNIFSQFSNDSHLKTMQTDMRDMIEGMKDISKSSSEAIFEQVEFSEAIGAL